MSEKKQPTAASAPTPQGPTQREIRLRAFQIYVAHGGRNGHDVDDWLQAEYELMQIPTEEIAQIPAPKKSTSPKKGAKKSLVEVVHQASHR